MPPSTPSDTDASADTETEAADDQRRFSRRQVLAAAGTGGVLGGAIGAVLGSRLDDPLLATASECDPDPLSTARHPWPHPEADAGWTGHAPEWHAPATLEGGWTVDHPFQRTGTPLVADGAVLLPAELDDERGGRFAAYDPGDGAEHWRTEYRPYRPRTATIAGDSVYAGREEGIGALSLADGADRWHASDVSDSASRDPVPWPFARDGRVVIAAPGDDGTRIGAFHGRTGRRCETASVPHDLRYGPTLSGPQAFFRVGWSSVYAFSLPDWTVDWRRQFDASTVHVPRVADGTVFVGGRGFLAALDPADGSTLWSRGFPARTEDDPASVPTPQIDVVTPREVVTRGPDPEDETTSGDGLTAFARADGSTLWHRSPDRDGAYRYSSVAAAGDALFVAFFDGEADEYRLVELDTATGEPRDTVALRVETPFEVAVGHGRVFVAGDDGIEAVGD